MPPRDASSDYRIRIKGLYARNDAIRCAMSRSYALMRFTHGPRRRELYNEIRDMKTEIGQVQEAIADLKRRRSQLMGDLDRVAEPVEGLDAGLRSPQCIQPRQEGAVSAEPAARAG